MTPASVSAKAVCLITGNHLCHNPRVLKEADTLSAAGHDVEVLGASFDASLARRDAALMSTRSWRFTPVIDLGSRGLRVGPAWLRARRKIGAAFAARCGWAAAYGLGYCAPELLRGARRSRAALFVAHSEQALWVAERLHADGRRVGADLEDWYSRDLPRDARADSERCSLRRHEAYLLRHGAYVSCPSEAMSHALGGAYGCTPPVVLYNAFAWRDRGALDGRIHDRRDRRLPSIHWYSQTIGPGRGLEDLLAALVLLDARVEVHLRGHLTGHARGWLERVVPRERKDDVHVHALVSNDELLSRIAEHDIGYAGEMPACGNRDLTVSNKILHYLLGGLAVVASDTAGQREVARRASAAVALYPAGDVPALASRLNALLQDRERLHAAKQAALTAAREVFCWEKQVPVLLAAVEAALK